MGYAVSVPRFRDPMMDARRRAMSVISGTGDRAPSVSADYDEPRPMTQGMPTAASIYPRATATPPQPMAATSPAPAAPTAAATSGRMQTGGGYQESYVPALARESDIYKSAQATQSDPFWAGVHQGLTPEEDADLERYIQTLYAMPKFPGSNERNRALASMYADRLRRNRKGNEIDFSGLSQIGDSFRRKREQGMALAAARGIGGSGIEGGMLSNLYGEQGRTEGDYIRGLVEQRRREQLAQQMFDQKMMYDLLGQSTQAHMQDEADPGWLGDILGLAGQSLPAIIGAL